MLHSYTYTFQYIFIDTGANKCNQMKLNEAYGILGGSLQLSALRVSLLVF